MKTYALCFGVNRYSATEAELRCAESDAQAIAKALAQECGALSHCLETVSTAAVLHRLALIAQELQAGDRVMIYFSGHACVTAQDYCLLMPRSNPAAIEQGNESELLTLTQMHALSSGPAWQGVQRLFMLDTGVAPAAAHLQQLAQAGDSAASPLHLLSSYATQRDKVEIPSARHSLFALTLLEELYADAAAEWTPEFAQALRERMQDLQQTHGLAACHPDLLWQTAPTVAHQPQDPWLQTLQAYSLDGLRNFLSLQPYDTPQANLARQIMALHKRHLQDEENWRQLQSSNTLTDWQAYLQQAPAESGRRSAARERIAELQEQAQSNAKSRLLTGIVTIFFGLIAVGAYHGWRQGKTADMQFHAPAAIPGGAGVMPGANQQAHGAPDAARAGAGTGQGAATDDLQTLYAQALQLLQNGNHPERMQHGLELLHQAAAQGHALAQLHLGLLYSDSDSPRADPAQAYHWLRKAALQGNALGQFHLARLYELGKGAPHNPALALEWYQKAAAQGLPEAQQALARLP